MKIYNKTTVLFLVTVVLAALFLAVKVEAAPVGLPEIMAGSTTATVGTTTVYGGLGGNYAVLNNDASADYGFNISPTVALFRPGCLNQQFTSIGSALCFILGTGTSGEGIAGSGRLMTSRTTINGATVYEIPALLFAGLNINGDVSADNLNYLLKFWNAHNLYRGNGDAEGNAWNLGNYAFNDKAQVVADGDYTEKLNSLTGSGVKVDSGSVGPAGNLYLYSAGAIGLPGEGDKDKYPEGKIWYVEDNLVLNNVTKFKGVGTIIVKGDFTLGLNAKLEPADADSRLGIIMIDADGRTDTFNFCNFKGNNKVNAMVYCDGTIKVDGNAEFKGSFVAKGFGIDEDFSVLFEYDTALDHQVPPGFRTLALPKSTEIGNK